MGIQVQGRGIVGVCRRRGRGRVRGRGGRRRDGRREQGGQVQHIGDPVDVSGEQHGLPPAVEDGVLGALGVLLREAVGGALQVGELLLHRPGALSDVRESMAEMREVVGGGDDGLVRALRQRLEGAQDGLGALRERLWFRGRESRQREGRQAGQVCVRGRVVWRRPRARVLRVQVRGQQLIQRVCHVGEARQLSQRGGRRWWASPQAFGSVHTSGESGLFFTWYRRQSS